MQRAQALLTVAAVPALALLAPGGSGPLAPLLTAVATAAWACAGWLALVAVLEHGSRIPGVLGRAAEALVRRLAPTSVRVLVRTAVGVGLVASLATGPVALAEDRTPTVAGSTSDSLDWPGLAPVTAAPVSHPTPSRSTASPTPRAARPSPAPRPSHAAAVQPTTAPDDPQGSDAPAGDVPASDRQVLVSAGDSLWSLAAASLGPNADAARVAQEWPRWWAANRSVVGDHPDLIHPGDRLSAPRPLGNPS